MAKEHLPATKDQAKYGAVRVGRCDPYCVLPIAWNSGDCIMCGKPCAHSECYEYTAWPIPDGDWTCEAGRSNSSKAFKDIVGHVNELIRSCGADLIRGNSAGVAQLIVAQLAHVKRMGGPGSMIDVNEREAIRRVVKRLRLAPVHADDRLDNDLVAALLERLSK